MAASKTAAYLFNDAATPGAEHAAAAPGPRREPAAWLELHGISRNNLAQLDASFPLGVLTAVTGVSGSGKSSLVSQALVDLVAAALGHELPAAEEDEPDYASL